MLQQAVLAAFFAREREFFLSGGAALAGYHLGHRETLDLDLFTTRPEAFERGRFVLTEVAAALPGQASARELREWLGELVQRLRRLAHPRPEDE